MSFVRGDIHWVAFPDRVPRGSEIEKQRPCIIVSLTRVNDIRTTVIVVPLTTGSRVHAPIVIPIPSAGGDSKAVCDQITAVDRRRLGNKIGSLSTAELRSLEESLSKVLGL